MVLVTAFLFHLKEEENCIKSGWLAPSLDRSIYSFYYGYGELFGLGFKYTSVETEINKKMSRMKKRQNFHPVLVREKIAPGKQPTFGDATRRVL